MPQLTQPYDEVKVPFQKMTFSPDVPSSALGPNEYNIGKNIEVDVRGIRSVSGDQAILSAVPGKPVYITGGYRNGGEFWFIIALESGSWVAANGTQVYKDITPAWTSFGGYTQATNITEAWNGTVPVFCDGINPPFFFPDEPNDPVYHDPPKLVVYSNLIKPSGITDIAYDSPTTQILTFDTPYASAPYINGQKITISGVNNYYNGTYTVQSSTTTTVTYYAVPGSAYPGPITGQQVSPTYTWNYNPNWKNLTAGFIRLYSTPNVGNILVAGNLTATNLDDSVSRFPITIQWSQAFGLNAMPGTWEPTILNVANQLEVPLRGEAVDAFPCNGQMFICSYWDTVVLSPMNYATTSAPILGVRLFNQGRGLLTANCWGNTDKLVYGFDARDIWAFDGQNFTGLGNQRVKNFFFKEMDPAYYDRAYMEVNSHKNQIEIYYTDSSAEFGVPNKMLSYRYDLDCWNPPRDVSNATFACESPTWFWKSGPPEYPVWDFNAASRTIVYARVSFDPDHLYTPIAQKDVGYGIADWSAVASTTGTPITSTFKRSNITLIKDYSGKLMVHRLLPEIYNIDAASDLTIDPETQTSLIGSVNIKIQGAESVGQAPTESTYITMATDTSEPWAQIDQNAHRVNNIEITNTSNSNIWICTATTWQYTQVEDDR
jgi:hypothetical protein